MGRRGKAKAADDMDDMDDTDDAEELSDEDLDGDQAAAATDEAEWGEMVGLPVFADVKLFKLHGNLERHDREGYLADFTRQRRAILLATDVAARGLDLPHVDWIVQYDPPQEVEEYIHRVGRTARLGKEGNAVVFLLPSEVGYVECLKQHRVDVKLLSEFTILHLFQEAQVAQHLKTLKLKGLASFLGSFVCKSVARDPDLLAKARRAFVSAHRAYHTYKKELKAFFNPRAIHLGHYASSFGLSEAPGKALHGAHPHTQHGGPDASTSRPLPGTTQWGKRKRDTSASASSHKPSKKERRTEAADAADHMNAASIDDFEVVAAPGGPAGERDRSVIQSALALLRKRRGEIHEARSREKKREKARKWAAGGGVVNKGHGRRAAVGRDRQYSERAGRAVGGQWR
mmetsp:Transcript_4755/g.12753  ORF Transcript_4755/g.12753 Transcript_4755/m.12753 type:complete len:401 (-) Transcript_4755:72-1274(-)